MISEPPATPPRLTSLQRGDPWTTRPCLYHLLHSHLQHCRGSPLSSEEMHGRVRLWLELPVRATPERLGVERHRDDLRWSRATVAQVAQP